LTFDDAQGMKPPVFFLQERRLIQYHYAVAKTKSTTGTSHVSVISQYARSKLSVAFQRIKESVKIRGLRSVFFYEQPFVPHE
jgi:hypothetical protein